jgi:hypothetical protein
MKRVLEIVVVVLVGLCAAGGGWAQEKPTPPAGQEKEKPAAADPITGDWDGSVDMPDGAMPFTLKMKLEKDKVTGEVGGPQGAVALSEGSFVDGKLTIGFTYVDGNAVVMTGAVADGQITGSLSYGGGQMVTNWAAKKKVAK